MRQRRCGSAGTADGVPLRAEGFPCRPLAPVLQPSFLCFPQPRLGWLGKTVYLLPGPAASFPPGRIRLRKAAPSTPPSPQLLSSRRRASLRDGSISLNSESGSASGGSLCGRYRDADFAARLGKCYLQKFYAGFIVRNTAELLLIARRLRCKPSSIESRDYSRSWCLLK